MVVILWYLLYKITFSGAYNNIVIFLLVSMSFVYFIDSCDTLIWSRQLRNLCIVNGSSCLSKATKIDNNACVLLGSGDIVGKVCSMNWPEMPYLFPLWQCVYTMCKFPNSDMSFVKERLASSFATLSWILVI